MCPCRPSCRITESVTVENVKLEFTSTLKIRGGTLAFDISRHRVAVRADLCVSREGILDCSRRTLTGTPRASTHGRAPQRAGSTVRADQAVISPDV